MIAPVLLCLVLPTLIVRAEHRLRVSPFFASPGLVVLGSAACGVGLVLFIATVRMLFLIGRGTIMPWDPTRKLVVGSLYSHVRNPMILSLLILLVGEALLFASYWIGVLAIVFFVINSLYFTFSEEPGLVNRFGEEYVEYRKNVPRWIPRLKPWHPH